MTIPDGHVSGHYAGGVSRLIAFLIDWFVITTVFSVLAWTAHYVIEAFTSIDVDLRNEPVLVAIGFAAWEFLYFTLWLAVTGRTVGKALLGIKVVTRAGAPLPLGRAAVRALAMPISFLVFGLGLLGIILGKERRALHDVIAGTSVVYDWGDRPAAMPAPLTRWIEQRNAELGARTGNQSAVPEDAVKVPISD